jgi:hypothetical protein
MICSTSCLNKVAALSAIILLALSGCAVTLKQASKPAPGTAGEEAIIPTPLNEGMLRAAGAPEEYIQAHAVRPAVAGLKKALVAVLPIENLSGTSAPLGEIRRDYIDKLKAHGIAVLDDDVLDDFMVKHRVRFTGGIDKKTASQFEKETGVQGVVITSLELYNIAIPPKIAIVSRLVTTGPEPKIKWMDDCGSSGADHPGLLNLGFISDAGNLMDKSLERLSISMAASMAGSVQADDGGRNKFRPKYYHRSPEFDVDRQYKIAVAPFFNSSKRQNAGEIMMLQFVEHLSKTPGLEPVEPGIVRDQMLRQRVVMNQGLTLYNAGAVMTAVDADLIFMGSVFDYQDFQGPAGTPKVDFTLQVMERKRNERSVWSLERESLFEVWSSKSQNKGDQGVFFFDAGEVYTAEKMSSEMVGNIVSLMKEK